MTACAKYLERLISLGGPISVDHYMTECLYNPSYGLYRTQNPIGKTGHFITAPEISPLFGEIIGLWAVSRWEIMGKPNFFWLSELGPGRGFLFQDILRVAKIRPDFLKAAKICFIELDGRLKKLQKEKFAMMSPIFIDSIHQMPEGPTILIANEFFDTLPIKQFQKTPNGLKERYIDFSYKEEQFFFTLGPPLPASQEEMDIPEGHIIETATIAESYADHIGNKIRKQNGCALFIDYGFDKNYEKPPPFGSLQAIYHHKKIDPLTLPGESDLSAHVDFDYLRRVFLKTGVNCTKTIPQGRFLNNLGIKILADKKKKHAKEKQKQDIDKGLDRLQSENHMGQLFKVMEIEQAK